MSICWLLGQQMHIAFVLVQSDNHHYDYFRALALRYATFFSLVSFLIMVAIIGLNTGQALALMMFALLTATRISVVSQKGSCMSSAPAV